MKKSGIYFFMILIVSLFLAGCGVKGDLYLPKQAQQPTESAASK